MLKELQRVCEQRQLDYYWNKEYNLLSRISHMEIYNIARRLKNIIKDIEKNATDKYILAKYIRKLCCINVLNYIKIGIYFMRLPSVKLDTNKWILSHMNM